MPRIRTLVVAAAMSLGALGVGVIHAYAASTPAPASDLGHDVQNAETGEHATTNDIDTAAEFNVDDGQVGQVGEQQTGENTSGQSDKPEGQSGDQQTGASAAGQSTASNGQSGSDGAGGQSTGTTTP